MKLVFPNGEHPQVLLSHGVNRIGSAGEGAVVLQAEGVVAHHCEIHVTTTGANLQVPGDGGPVSVNGKPVADIMALRAGDMIGIGPVQARFAIVEAARTLQFRSVNIDLIYGLPLQTPERFARTVAEVIALQPDRLSLFNYAHLPERFMPQRRINTSDLPSPGDKLAMLQASIEQLSAAGYRYIGMDHFALPDDELASAQEDGSLQRNFQGYTTHGHCDLIGLGVSSISQIGELYCQNNSDLSKYQDSLGHSELATLRGLHCDADDRVRRAVIQQLICHFQLRFADIEQAYAIDFRNYFAEVWPQLQQMASDGLIELNAQGIEVRPAGRLLVRSLCMLFDRYLSELNQQRFSRVI